MREAATIARPIEDVQATVFNIQRSSIHDGPGIRTTVFLKGCPLRCDWCHNPEGLSRIPELAITADRCVFCDACAEVCPSSSPQGAARGPGWDNGSCRTCGVCADACPSGARELVGEVRCAAELVDELERDRPFFEASGGGVTFSGGEPLFHPSFLAACLEACREKGLHTAVDTSGFAPKKVIREIARLADVLLYDLKHMDPEAHERHTGVGNQSILENLQSLSEEGRAIWIRFPLIPGFNDDHENLEAMATFVSALANAHPLFVLPYHPIGVDKGRRLGRAEPEVDYQSPSEDHVEAVVGQLRSHGLEVHTGGACE